VPAPFGSLTISGVDESSAKYCGCKFACLESKKQLQRQDEPAQIMGTTA
jgi:hypothetical protein